MVSSRTTVVRGRPGIGQVLRARPVVNAVMLTLFGLGLVACTRAELMNDYDPASGASKKDYEGLVGRRGQDAADAKNAAGGEPPIPDFQSVLAAPSAPELADTRRVSIAVTETTPLRDILIELARKAEVDLELDPRISGGVIMTATDRPFIEVIDRLATLAELRYSFERNILKVEVDDPYLEQYRMDVLNQTRSSSSDISSSTDASSAAQAIGSGSSGGGNNNSSSAISSKSDSDFWTGIGQNISQILQSIQSRRGAAGREIKAELKETLKDEPSNKGDNVLQQVASDEAKALSTENEDPELELKSESGGGGATTSISNYSVNAQAGLITVFANQRQQKAIERYLRTVRDAVSQQVLVEAKILEITLDDQYRAGINWQAFIGPGIFNAAGTRIGENISLTTNFSRDVVPADFTNPTVTAVFQNSDQDLNAAAQLVKKFGTVRTLSSPRLTITNNQSAILKVAQNQIFFDLNVTREQSQVVGRADTITVDSQIKSVPVGLIMNVQPSIDSVTRRISMSLRPSITRITGYVPDPGVAITVAQVNAQGGSGVNVSSQIPVIEVREMDSMVSMSSGETVIMGGLMQEMSENSREGLPGLMDVPLIGQAASQNIRASKVTELVIFLRATIVQGRESVSDEDIRLYKTFTPDPRPLAF